MDSEYYSLIDRVEAKLNKTPKKTHHIILQVHTALQHYKATGGSKEILEHYLTTSNRIMGRIFYFEGEIYDFTNMKIQKYARSNRFGKWIPVNKFHGTKLY